MADGQRGTQVLVALIGATATIVAALIAIQPWDDGGGSGGGGTPTPASPVSSITLPDRTTARVFASRDSGPGGSTVNVSGEGFASGERVVLRFHTEEIGSTTASPEGSFANVGVTVPTTFSAFAPQQFDIIATGDESIRTATTPFTITG